MSIILRFKYLLLLIFLPLLLVFIWFNGGLIIGKGEEGLIFYNLSKNLELSQSAWVDVNTGMPNLYWLPRLPALYIASFLEAKLGFPQHIIQAGLFYLLIVTGIVSVYYLTQCLLEHHPSRYVIAFISALFYLLNPFSVSQVWGRGLYPQYFSFALFPLSLLLLVYGLSRRKYIYLILLLFSSAIYSWAFGIVTTVVCYWVILGGYFIWWLATNRFNKREIFSGSCFMILFFLGWLLINAWWFLPFIIKGNAVFAGYLSQPSENLGTLLGVSRSFPPDVIIRLLQKGYFFDATAYSQIYSTITFQLISFIPLVFVLTGLVKTIKNPDLIKFRFFVVLLLLGLVVSLGANPPFGKIFVWVFENFPLLQAFRNPFEKFGLVYALGYSPLFAFGLLIFFGKVKLKFLGLFIAIFLICGIYAWPMWNGRVLAGINNKIGVKVPKYYEELNTWLQKNDSQGYRIFMTPLLVGEAGVFQWEDTKYNGVDPMHFILDRAAISNGTRIPFYFDFAQNIRKYMTRENIIPALSLLRTKFLIDRKDMIDVTDAEQEQNQFLTSSIFSPLGVENNLKSICQNITADSKSDGLAWAVCRIDRANNDLSTTMYLHIRVKTDLSANLEISLRDTKGTRIYWHGRVDSDYRTDANSWQVITLSLSTPTEGDKSIDLSRSDVLEIWAYSKDHPERSVGQINVSEIKLDPGIKKGINEFKKTAQLGQLTVFEPIHFNPPPEFGVLASINIVKDFPQFFEEVNKKRELTHKEGFVLSSQNNQKNLQNLTDTIPTEVVDKYKISNTKYWMRFNQRQGKSSLILSKTFNPEWKVIVGASKEQLSGSFFDDLSLLKAVVLPEENHFVVNGYANLWSFRNDQKQLAIVFLPQVYADLGLKISVFSVIILSLVWGISPVVKKR
ncbi:hypothetical protein A3D83_01330 [Candidatus Daviesbacteria bacterium RIFCSPHIGHO2_02_FULL_41_10]|uniref:Membrane protein 6-pyruvoyl-tetrahydropterin synthase-related domain-containing protein n=1 Tax=Candidatus Daviesbacteria bacterium RIFCSPHIGHO2_02_FULL_41_10 TaxID=1797774 RepID=A0A1F5JY56_9BACT|nr:MAG: hypothetical protein A3D83_01330 [Candidatus Daviesbacteria bacterium RIFCSPHIGHO2_02_FULL_41_10]